MSGAPIENNRQADRIRGLILDYGEVLCHRPAPGKMERMAEIAGLAPATFAARYHRERDPYDRGDLSPAGYWSKVVSGAVPLDAKLVATLQQSDVEMWCDINRDMTEWLDELRAAGYKTALLSNMQPDMARHARRSFDWLHRLDCVVLSCEVRLIKPGRAIYARCVEGLHLRPSETCFIDDRETNVRGAREAGLMAVQFRTVESLRDDLAAIGFTVLPQSKASQAELGADTE